MTQPMQFHELNAAPGDRVTVMADCVTNGMSIVVPEVNFTNAVALDYINGGYVYVENNNGKLKAYHTGWCYGDPDLWIKEAT